CRNSDVLVRWGGDEFLVVGRNADVNEITVLPERIRTMIESAAFEVGDGQVAQLTCSIGFTTIPILGGSAHSVNLEQAVALADAALYMAKKEHGRNAWVGLLGSAATTAEGLHRCLRNPDDAMLAEQLEVRASTEKRPAPERELRLVPLRQRQA